MRVLMTADGIGGVFSYAVTLVRALASEGVEVVLATMGARLEEDQRRELRGIRGLVVHESAYALEWMEEPFSDVDAAGAWLLELEQEFRPDVVHLNGYSHAALDWRAPTLVVAHSSVSSWWRAVFGEDAPERYAEYRRRVRAGLAAAGCVVAPTSSMLRALAEHDGYSGTGLIIPNGADPGAYRRGPKEPLIVAAGRLWDLAKNLALVERALPRLPWPVRIAGALGNEQRATRPECLGRLSRADVAAWMARARIFVHPARYEPFGLAPLEAALSGCALVLGDIESLREVWEDAALYVPVDDAEALVDAVKRLASDAAFEAELVRRATERAASFGVARMVRGYFDAYGALLTRSIRAQGAGDRS